MKRIIGCMVLLLVLVFFGTAQAVLYFPHSASDGVWETEIAMMNTNAGQTVSGTLRAYADTGQEVESMAITLGPHGRREITIGQEFTSPGGIGYLVFETDSAGVAGYTKFYIVGRYRVAVPAVSEVNTGDIYISHIASDQQYWTGVSLLNATSATKSLTIEFNTGQSKSISLAANEHRAFLIKDLFDGQPQPDLKSAVIKHGSGVVGLELFGSTETSGRNYLSGILLKDQTATTIYYPHIESDATWWTGIVAYNPGASSGTLTITPYTEDGTALSPQSLPIAAGEKYIGLVSDLNLPAGTAWLQIQGTIGITGFELFGTNDGAQLAGYTGVGISGKERIFAKLEKDGWTGIAFVNIEDSAASVTLTAYNDTGTVVATQAMNLGTHAKVVQVAGDIFTQDISSATYIGYTSDRNLVGFQLNGSTGGMMLDGLPGMSGSSIIGPAIRLTRVDFSVPPPETPALSLGRIDVPFGLDLSQRKYINVVVDLSGNDIWSNYYVADQIQEEWVVQNHAALVDVVEPNQYSFSFYDRGTDSRTNLKGKAILTDEPINVTSWNGISPQNVLAEVNFTISSVEQETLSYSLTPGYYSGFSASSLATDKPPKDADPSSLLRPMADGGFTAFNAGVPDINQGPNECVPTSAANSLRWLAKKHGYEDKLPESDRDLIEELKKDMKWDADNGVMGEDFIPGKDKFTQDNNLPIETHLIGGSRDTGVVEKIKEEIDKGQAIEMTLSFWLKNASGDWVRKGGHMVSLVGASSAGTSTFVDFHDPDTDSLLDIYKVSNTEFSDALTLPNYLPPCTTIIEEAFAQSPVGVTPTECAALADLLIEMSTTAITGEISHLPYTGDPINNNMLLFTVEDSTINVSGNPPFVDVTGTVDDQCNFTATGVGTVAGYPNVSVAMEGGVSDSTLSGTYTMGAGGELPGGMPIIFHFAGDL